MRYPLRGSDDRERRDAKLIAMASFLPVELADLEHDPGDERQDDHHRNHESPSAESKIIERLHPAAMGLHADGESGFGLLLHRVNSERMDGRTGPDQGVLGAIEVELGLTHLHPGLLGPEEKSMGFVKLSAKSFDQRPHLGCALPALVLSRVTGRADGFVPE